MKQFKPKENGVQLPWNDDLFIEKWTEWLQYRRERHIATYKPTGLKNTFKALIEDSGNNVQTAIAMINQSMARSWQGIFPIKQQLNGKDNSGTFGGKPVSQSVGQTGIGEL